MRPQVVTISPQGQITIPAGLRRLLFSRKYLIELHDEVLVLKPCRIVMNAKDFLIKKDTIGKVLSLSENAKQVYLLVHQKSRTANNIIENLNLSVSEINVILTKLEFSGLVRKNAYLWEVV
jgi:predicted transcriptional regulator